MRYRFEVPSRRGFYHAVGVAVFLLIMGGTSAYAEDFSDEEMQPLAATAFDLARSVRRHAVNNPNDAANLNDRELVRRATAHDPSLMKPYEDFMIRGLPQGVVLICTEDGKRGLIEDAACSNNVDSKRWNDHSSACEFEVDLNIACGAKR